MFTTISTYYTFPKTIEQIRRNMTDHATSRYQGLNSSEVGAKIENLGTRLDKQDKSFTLNDTTLHLIFSKFPSFNNLVSYSFSNYNFLVIRIFSVNNFKFHNDGPTPTKMKDSDKAN